MRRIAALLNASAGTIERKGVGAVRNELVAAFAAHGISASVELIPGAELRAAAERALRQVADRELDAIVVGGGDGTVRTVAAVLAGSGVALGILPLGTLNHFARDLGIPLAPDEAVAVIAAGAQRSVDLGEVNGTIFINNSSIGVYPYLVLERERRRHRLRISKWAAMILALPRFLRHLPVFRLTISAAGSIEPCRSPCVLVGNNEYRLTVPAFGRRERLDRGELCAYVAKAQSVLSLFVLACRCMLGAFDLRRDLRIIKADSADVSARRKRLLVAIDGEVETMRAPLHYRSRPGALRVFAPA
jgi:diacylglycerol kinase family enzyme